MRYCSLTWPTTRLLSGLLPQDYLNCSRVSAWKRLPRISYLATDMTNYCDAFARQIGAAREEVPGRCGYPGHINTDFSYAMKEQNCERKEGFNHPISILTMPGDDITHPITDPQVISLRDKL